MLSDIEWTDRTWNPGVWGCAKAGPECLKCYAMGLAHRLSAQGHYPENITRSPDDDEKGAQWTGLVLVGTVEQVRLSAEEHLPKRPRKDGRQWRIFTTSMADLFHLGVPFWFVDAVMEIMAAYWWCDFQVLTKRAARMAAYDADRADRGLSWPRNVWAGVTAGTQKGVDERVPYLQQVRATVRFLSCEPLLELVELPELLAKECRHEDGYVEPDTNALVCQQCEEAADIHMVITGCESGTTPRKTDPAWYRALRDQCSAAGVSFFLKQADFGEGKGIESLPFLDGRQWAEFPAAA